MLAAVWPYLGVIARTETGGEASAASFSGWCPNASDISRAVSWSLKSHASSSLSAGDVWGSLIALIAFYSLLLVVEMYLMIKFARLGPSSLHSGRYHFEQQQPAHA